MATQGDPGGGGGRRLVVDFAALQAAHRVVSGAHDTAEDAFGRLADVGAETTYARRLDEALATYARDLQRAAFEVVDTLAGLRDFLVSSQTGVAAVDHGLGDGLPYSLQDGIPHATTTDHDGTVHDLDLNDPYAVLGMDDPGGDP